MKNVFNNIIKYWHDPVWSRVIATGICAILTYLIVKIVALIHKIDFLQACSLFVRFFTHTSNINNLFLIIVLLVLLLTLFQFNCFRKLYITHCKNDATINKIECKETLPELGIITTAFFENRICDAFPATRGLLIIENPKIIHDRFDIFFQEPIKFSTINVPYRSDPIWFFRGGSSSHIDSYKRISKTKCLLKYDEIKLSRIAVYHPNAYYKAFIYCETFSEKPVIGEKYTKDEIDAMIKKDGYLRQHYALYKNMIVTMQESADGSAVRNGKVISISGSELRIRCLSKYNFILAAPDSPLNSLRFEMASEPILNGLLRGAYKIQDLVDIVDSLHKTDGQMRP